MIVTFDVKYGKNVIEIMLQDGKCVKTEFIAKYGKNKVIFPTTDYLSIEFFLKYGRNEVAVEIPNDTEVLYINKRLKNLFNAKVTIYNDITATDGSRLFERFVIDKCQITGQLVDKPRETIRTIVNSDTVITKDVEHYIKPIEYINLSAEERVNCYTVQAGDFVVFGEVDDIVTDAKEYIALQNKYKHCGIKITSVSANINGMTIDNIMMTNV